MTEIERIQALIIKNIPPSKTGDLSDVYICAKAIEQYVIKARIEELEKIPFGVDFKYHRIDNEERIESLKKGIE